jgi:hypothetical protein
MLAYLGYNLRTAYWKLPLDTGSRGTVDRDVYYVESVVSVHDGGEWVADIDVLQFGRKLYRLECQCVDQEQQALQSRSMATRFTSLDKWEELLDAPQGIGIFRAHGNWAARLAAASMLAKKSGESNEVSGTAVVVGPSVPCLRCARRFTRVPHKSSYGQVKFFID